MGSHWKKLTVDSTSNNDEALRNNVIAAFDEFGSYGMPVNYLAIKSREQEFVFTLAVKEMRRGTLQIGGISRQWANGLNRGDIVEVTPYHADKLPSQIKLDVIADFVKSVSMDEYNTDLMSMIFDQLFRDHIFTKGQPMPFKLGGLPTLLLTIKDITCDGVSVKRGIYGDLSQVWFTTHENDSPINLSGNRITRRKELIRHDFKYEDLGIGGLDEEFNVIFRRAFASRILPPKIVEKLGVPHVKGLLLYGPPGTGKTLIARQIGKMLNAREPKVVSGPEVLSKMVGESEKNVRKLFADAEKEYKAKGEESELHVIILDELDAICKQRGSRSGDTGVGDSIVNQLLAKMDGVDQLNNILVIGMTNRKDMIDDALLRPGRLEVHMEVGLPDEDGRLQILKIHTNKMRQNDIIAGDVKLEVLAEKTKNFSGAEIQGLVKAATSYAFTRHVDLGTSGGTGGIAGANFQNMKVNMDDFSEALKEVLPAFGVSEVELMQCVQNDIIPFEKHIKDILADGDLYINQVTQSSRTPLLSVLLHGRPGSGKTALAAQIALQSQSPFIKLISPETMVGLTESAKINAINKIFSDSYKSPLSVIVVDDIERLLGYVKIGPWFSNTVLQALLVLIKKSPPEGRRLLVLGTTSSKSIMEQMGMFDSFSQDIYVPDVSSLDGLRNVVKELDLFTEQELEEVIQKIKEGLALDDKRERSKKKLKEEYDLFSDQELDDMLKMLENGDISIGVKQLLMIAEMARQDENKVDKFVNTIIASPFGEEEEEEGEE